MGGFIVFALLTAAGIAFAVGSLAKRRGVVNAAWGSAASSRHLLFKPAELLSGPEIVGTLHGCRVRVDTVSHGGDNAKKYTRFVVEYLRPVGLDLKLTERGTWSSITTFFGGQDIETGDRSFDESVVVKGTDPERVARFLTAARRHRIIDLFRELPKAVIKDTEVTWEREKIVETSFAILEPLDRMVALSRNFTSEGDLGGPIVEELLRPVARTVIGGAAVHVVDLPARAPEPATGPGSASTVTLAPAPAGPPGPPEPTARLSPQWVVDALFGPSVLSYQRAEIFERRLRGRHVRWSGTLASVTPYSFDRIFGNEPGARAIVKVFDSPGATARPCLQAIVQLSREAPAELRGTIGKRVVFEGELQACEAFGRSVFLSGGSVTRAESVG